MRRPKFEDPAELREKIEEYFTEKCGSVVVGEGKDAHLLERPPTLSGLALALGTTRKTLLEWIDTEDGETARNPGCVQLLVEAKARIEAYMESRLITDYNRGLEFIMTNGYRGWAARRNLQVDAELSHGGEVRHKVDATVSLSDEELLARIETLRARADEIARRESAE